MGEPKPAPDWWKEDPERSWREFMELQDECSRLGRVCSNVEFQRNWTLGCRFSDDAQTLGLCWVVGFPGVPHPEYEDECEAKIKPWNRWIMWLRGLAARALKEGHCPDDVSDKPPEWEEGGK